MKKNMVFMGILLVSAGSAQLSWAAEDRKNPEKEAEEVLIADFDEVERMLEAGIEPVMPEVVQAPSYMGAMGGYLSNLPSSLIAWARGVPAGAGPGAGSAAAQKDESDRIWAMIDNKTPKAAVPSLEEIERRNAELRAQLDQLKAKNDELSAKWLEMNKREEEMLKRKAAWLKEQPTSKEEARDIFIATRLSLQDQDAKNQKAKQ